MMETPAFRAVLKRKKHVLGSLLTITDTLLTSFTQQGVVTEQQAEGIKVECSNNQEKVNRLLDVVQVPDEASFKKFCDVIGGVDQWLQEELLAVAKVELGKLPVEGYIQSEAAMLVHRRFGRSRRISETDKKQMATLMATQIQSTKEACRRQLDQANSNREHLEQSIQEVQDKVSGLNTKVQQFVRSHSIALKEAPVLDMRSTTQALLGMTRSESQTPISQLEEQLDFLLTRFNRLLTERACMVNDRQKLSEVLKLKLTGPVTDPIVDKLAKVREENEALVKYLRQKVINLEEKVNASQATVEEKQKIIARLRTDMEGLEKELDTFKQNIESMTAPIPSAQPSDAVGERRKVMNSNSAPCMTSIEKKWSSSSSSSGEMYQSKANDGTGDVMDRLNLPPIHPGTPKASPMTTRKFHRCSGTDRRT